MPKPGVLVYDLERSAKLPRGEAERFTGYGVVGLPFKSGHILCLRRWPASSLGQAYTSLWHRDPSNRWTFIQNVPPQFACTRYFGSAVAQYLERPINLKWSGPWDFSVVVAGDYEINWQVSLKESLAARLLNALGGLIPNFLWHQQRFLKNLEKLGGVLMGSGRLSLTGRLPNGQWFISHPRFMWEILASRATVRGQDLGAIGPLPEQAHLGDFWVPQEGRFFIGQAFLEPYDQDRHLVVFSQEGQAFGFSH